MFTYDVDVQFEDMAKAEAMAAGLTEEEAEMAVYEFEGNMYE